MPEWPTDIPIRTPGLLSFKFFEIKIIEEVNNFNGKVVLLGIPEGVTKIFVIGGSHILGRCKACIFPTNIDEATQRKLPGVDHIDIENIHVILWVEAFRQPGDTSK